MSKDFIFKLIVSGVALASLIAMATALWVIAKRLKNRSSKKGVDLSKIKIQPRLIGKSEFKSDAGEKLTEIWAAYRAQQYEILSQIIPIVDSAISLCYKNRRKPKKQKHKKNESTQTVDLDNAVDAWTKFKERQNSLLEEFGQVFKDEELYFKRIIDPLESIADDGEKRTFIWSQLERYKWTASGLSQVIDISNNLLHCKDLSEYCEQSELLARVMLAYIDKIKEQEKN